MRTRLGPCPAARQLGQLVDEGRKSGLTQTFIAEKQLGISQALLSQYLSGRIVPGPVLRRAIEKWSGGRIPVDAWDTAEDRALLARVKPLVPPAPKHRRGTTREPASDGAAKTSTDASAPPEAQDAGGTGA